jgi:hypothetical protein
MNKMNTKTERLTASCCCCCLQGSLKPECFAALNTFTAANAASVAALDAIKLVLPARKGGLR